MNNPERGSRAPKEDHQFGEQKQPSEDAVFTTFSRFGNSNSAKSEVFYSEKKVVLMQFAKETRFVFLLEIPFQKYKEAFKHVEQLVF